MVRWEVIGLRVEYVHEVLKWQEGRVCAGIVPVGDESACAQRDHTCYTTAGKGGMLVSKTKKEKKIKKEKKHARLCQG